MATAVKDSDVSHTSSDEAAVPLPILMLGSILVAFIIVLCCRSEPRETFFVHTGGWTAVPQEAEEAADGGQKQKHSRGRRRGRDLEQGHERARSISKRYRELREKGKSARSAMAAAEKEVSDCEKRGGSLTRDYLKRDVRVGGLVVDPWGQKVVLKSSSSSSSVLLSPSSSSTVKMADEEITSLRVYEKKLLRCRCLREQGYDAAQALFLSDLPREEPSDIDYKFNWYGVQQDVTGFVYYWNGDRERPIVRWEKPVRYVWHRIVVSSSSKDGGETEAHEWVFGDGMWNLRSAVELPPRQPPEPGTFAKNVPSMLSRHDKRNNAHFSSLKRQRSASLPKMSSPTSLSSSKTKQKPTKSATATTIMNPFRFSVGKWSPASPPSKPKAKDATRPETPMVLRRSSSYRSSTSASMPRPTGDSIQHGSFNSNAVQSSTRRDHPLNRPSMTKNGPGGFGSGPSTRKSTYQMSMSSSTTSKKGKVARSQSEPRRQKESKTRLPLLRSNQTRRTATKPSSEVDRTAAKGNGHGQESRGLSLSRSLKRIFGSTSTEHPVVAKKSSDATVLASRMKHERSLPSPRPPTDRLGRTWSDYMAMKKSRSNSTSRLLVNGSGASQQSTKLDKKEIRASRSLSRRDATFSNTKTKKITSSVDEQRILKTARKVKAARDAFMQKQAEEALAAAQENR